MKKEDLSYSDIENWMKENGYQFLCFSSADFDNKIEDYEDPELLDAISEKDKDRIVKEAFEEAVDSMCGEFSDKLFDKIQDFLNKIRK